MAMRWIVAMILVLALGTSGCGKRRRGLDSSAESAEAAQSADTAVIDSAGNDALPSIDGGQSQANEPSVTADSGSVSNDYYEGGKKKKKKKRRHTADASGDGMPVADSAPPVQGTGQMANYTVQRGDTLMKIAFNVYGDINQWRAIYELNRDVIHSANSLASGMSLKYDKPASEPMIEKNGDPYMIKTGDTLGTIAYDIYAKKNKWKKLWENNRTLIRDPNKIYAGFYLYYQITEEEKREAEELKGGGGMPLAVGKDALKGGGLNGLTEPSKVAEPTRAPANTRSN